MCTPHGAGEPLSATPGRNDPQLDFRKPDTGPPSRQTEVTTQRQLQGAADTSTADRADDRLLEVLGELHEPEALSDKALQCHFGNALTKLANIRTDGEALLSGTREDDHAYGLVGFELREQLLEPIDHSQAHRIVRRSI